MTDHPPLPYGRQSIDDADVEALTEILRRDFLTTGPAVPQFEADLCAATGAARAVAVSSGTAAIHALYAAAGLGPGSEIVTSPLTFAATANAALYLGASVRFADVSPDTGNLDPPAAAHALTERTRAVVAIDFAGHPADYGALRPLAEQAGARLLADAAHSLGATQDGCRVGTLADASALSFHPVKAITTGEGGAVVTNDTAIADRAARFRTHGITRDRDLMERDEGAWFYEQVDLGFNYRLTDIQAALGSSQLRRLDAFIGRRRAIAARYREALGDVDGLELPSVRPGVAPAWHLYVVRVRDAARRRPFFDRLRALGLGVQVHYIPVYWHPYYRERGYRRGLCPVAEDLYQRSVSLPIFPRMTDGDLDSSIERVLQAAADTL